MSALEAGEVVMRLQRQLASAATTSMCLGGLFDGVAGAVLADVDADYSSSDAGRPTSSSSVSSSSTEGQFWNFVSLPVPVNVHVGLSQVAYNINSEKLIKT